MTTAGKAPFFANVTFEPGCRNNWHIHRAKSGGGQILLCVAGSGWYREWGKPAISLNPGDVVEIPANVKHWHGAKKDSWFSHIAVEMPGEETSNEWLEAVTDEEYAETGKVHFSQSVATDSAGDLAYSVKYMNAFERVMAFDGQDLPETGLSVLVDGEKTDAVLDRENFVLHLNGLEGDREYLLEIYDGEKILLWEKFTTPAIGVAQPSAESTFESITVQFNMTNPHDEAVTLVYGTSAETLGRVPVGSGNVAETFTGLEAYTNYVFDVVRDSDGLKLKTFSARTDSRMIISANFVKETLDDEGRTVTLIPRGTDMFDDDPDALGVELFAAAEPGSYELEIVSESGYTLPFAGREVTPDQPVSFTVYTEFAASGETYAIRLLPYGEIGDEVVETRYIRIDDGESEVVYPEFTITVEPDKTTNGNYILGLIAEGAPLPEPATGLAGGYRVEIMNAAGDNTYVGGKEFTEFATGETITVVLEAVDPGVSDLEIQISYHVGGFDSGYLIYSGISELSDIR